MHCRKCHGGCVDSSLVKGKIVLCDETTGYYVARDAGAAGSILKDDKLDNISLILPFPASVMSPDNFNIIISYLNSTKYH